MARKYRTLFRSGHHLGKRHRRADTRITCLPGNHDDVLRQQGTRAFGLVGHRLYDAVLDLDEAPAPLLRRGPPGKTRSPSALARHAVKWTVNHAARFEHHRAQEPDRHGLDGPQEILSAQ